MISIIDYGMGNLGSVAKAISCLGINFEIIQDPQSIKKAKAIILPGVGSFGATIDNLHKLFLFEPLKDFITSKKPFLGICLGLQILLSDSQESKTKTGLNLIKGTVKKFKANDKLKVPHMGWNQVFFEPELKNLFHNIEQNSFFYFVHSYYVDLQNKKLPVCYTDYGKKFISGISFGEVSFALQFHPEKSGQKGLVLLDNFAKIAQVK